MVIKSQCYSPSKIHWKIWKRDKLVFNVGIIVKTKSLKLPRHLQMNQISLSKKTDKKKWREGGSTTMLSCPKYRACNKHMQVIISFSNICHVNIKNVFVLLPKIVVNHNFSYSKLWNSLCLNTRKLEIKPRKQRAFSYIIHIFTSRKMNEIDTLALTTFTKKKCCVCYSCNGSRVHEQWQ